MSLGNTIPDYFSEESDVEQDAEINNIDQIRRREKKKEIGNWKEPAIARRRRSKSSIKKILGASITRM